MSFPALDPDTLRDLAAVRGGADVFNYATARRLRALSRTHPDLVTITQAGGEYGPRDVHPYFGAIASAQGRELLDSVSPTRTYPAGTDEEYPTDPVAEASP